MNILTSGAQQLGLSLTGGQIEQFEAYYRELADWNTRMNLTAVTGYEEAQVKHFLDSLTVLTALSATDRTRPLSVIDVGTGAGLPGLPLKIALPRIRLALLEATAKKTRFLSHVVAKLGLADVTVITGRAETTAREEQYREKFDIALARALAPLPALVELALPFCAAGGRLIALKKGDINEEIERSRKAIEVLGGALSEVRPVTLEWLDDRRVLVIIDKTRPAPPAYPRRPGMPAKRPIQG